MFKSACLTASLLLASTSVDAVVIRHDVAKEKYLVAKGHPALVDMRHEGHGMLIAPEWVVTAAHVIFYDYKGKTITIGGQEREIEQVIFHPGYAKPAKGIFSGYSGPSQAYLRGNHDIALVKLKAPVTDVKPIQPYEGSDEIGEIVTLYGRGNTGTGVTGQVEKTKGTLRRAQNTISSSADHWLHYRFDQGDNALPLEGFQGNGDSGGPAIIRKDGMDYLAGLASWDVYDGDLKDFKGSIYGMEAALIRMSYYKEWMSDVMSWSAEKRSEHHHRFAGAK